jgi:hypothetical protein
MRIQLDLADTRPLIRRVGRRKLKIMSTIFISYAKDDYPAAKRMFTLISCTADLTRMIIFKNGGFHRILEADTQKAS